MKKRGASPLFSYLRKIRCPFRDGNVCFGRFDKTRGRRGGYQDPNSGRIYVPLTVKDKTGAKFTYFVTVKFNQNVPSPDEWPTKRDWTKAEKGEQDEKI